MQDLTEARLVRRFDFMPHEMLDNFIALIQTIFNEILPPTEPTRNRPGTTAW